MFDLMDSDYKISEEDDELMNECETVVNKIKSSHEYEVVDNEMNENDEDVEAPNTKESSNNNVRSW